MGADEFFIDTLFTLHHIVELRTEEGCQLIEPTGPPHNLPLHYTLRVLEAHNFHPSLLAGQTFHRLERCQMGLGHNHHHLNQGLFTEMPVCTRLDVEDLGTSAFISLRRCFLAFFHDFVPILYVHTLSASDAPLIPSYGIGSTLTE